METLKEEMSRRVSETKVRMPALDCIEFCCLYARCRKPWLLSAIEFAVMF